MADTMVEIDIEDLFLSGLGNDAPVLRLPYGAESLALLDELEIESFTREGIIDRLVSRNSYGAELDIEDFFVTGLHTDTPVIRPPVNAGLFDEVPLGARAPLPGDNMHLIDFDENVDHDFTPGLSTGVVLVGVTERQSVIIGTIADAVIGFNGLGIIDFIKFGQFKDVMA